MKILLQQEKLMEQALQIGQMALESADVPVGALLVDANNNVVATGYNQKEAEHDPTCHAEIVALRAAGRKLRRWRLHDLTLVVTLEPCVMCAGAILAARIPRVIFAAWDEKAGACGSVYDVLRDRRLLHQVEVFAGVKQLEAKQMLQQFFTNKR